ncbi:hypothetical protein FA95DRAFT_1577268 [Auriscalpium vulgare]|uniref:Uncharacterized protein n=1 Tax=Auriscalpium vulgare TaxID=40419 RepID=A0ACB8R7T1_9AGAM|nr:hypothetical protein FA95DRAFT_1577268 [Auriscalpium vulgare]
MYKQSRHLKHQLKMSTITFHACLRNMSSTYKQSMKSETKIEKLKRDIDPRQRQLKQLIIKYQQDPSQINNDSIRELMSLIAIVGKKNALLVQLTGIPTEPELGAIIMLFHNHQYQSPHAISRKIRELKISNDAKPTTDIQSKEITAIKSTDGINKAPMNKSKEIKVNMSMLQKDANFIHKRMNEEIDRRIASTINMITRIEVFKKVYGQRIIACKEKTLEIAKIEEHIQRLQKQLDNYEEII